MAKETFSDDDEGKSVVNNKGDQIGIVTEVHRDTVNAPRGQAPGLPASTTRFALTASR